MHVTSLLDKDGFKICGLHSRRLEEQMTCQRIDVITCRFPSGLRLPTRVLCLLGTSTRHVAPFLHTDMRPVCDLTRSWPAPDEDAEPARVDGGAALLLIQFITPSVEMLESRGEAFLSEIAPCCSGTGLDEMGIINLIDPDGIFIELVGPIRRREPPPPPEWCRQQ